MATQTQLQLPLGDALGFLSDPFGSRQRAEERAARAAQQGNLSEAIRIWDRFKEELQGIENPYGEAFTRNMITQDRDIASAGASNELEQARRLSGASGLGRGGALANRERMIREEMTRRNAASAGNIRQQAATQSGEFQRQMADMFGQVNAAQSTLYANSPVSLAPTTFQAGQQGIDYNQLAPAMAAGREAGMTDAQLNEFFAGGGVYDPVRGFQTTEGTPWTPSGTPFVADRNTNVTGAFDFVGSPQDQLIDMGRHLRSKSGGPAPTGAAPIVPQPAKNTTIPQANPYTKAGQTLATSLSSFQQPQAKTGTTALGTKPPIRRGF